MDEVKEKFEEALRTLKETVDVSFKKYEKDKTVKNEMVKMWQDTISNFLQYAVKTSEKHQSRDLYRSIARALIFGK
ncbi:hypothetical protein ACETAC_04585 [Aceticella autotrophica]|uniref:Uncharacterized protein n=1 Tax=Aceticella autotrophica TaxID=2755338 RepID=A0A975AXD3_9THEO|nr:hypothetical protein [Aceticella autotrophica]MDI6603903.1 hypothetical protein [Thermoanaerobacteraceae bacterium]QSZ28131.1 hypothetical protein ACETAC_04585 [Aceticella autotrophica]